MQNPPIPAQARIWNRPVTPDMTSWAISILETPFSHPMFSVSQRWFGGSAVLARVEWHDWSFRSGVRVQGLFRGVTLYEVIEPPGAAVEGLDVSNYQGQIAWNELAASGKAFAFIKATEGTSLIDAKFERNWQLARGAGMLRGAYHCFRAKEDPLAQAKLFLSKLDTKGELPVALDVETGNGLRAADVATGVAAWVDYVSAHCGRPLVYASPGFWGTLPRVGVESKADLWVVDWGVASPGGAAGWRDWAFWQYANSADIPGVPVAVDLTRFHGSLDELHTYLTRREDGTSRLPMPLDLTTVAGVQTALNYLGCSPTLATDGVIGARTRAAIESFQAAAALIVDGVIGSATRSALQKAIAKAAPEVSSRGDLSETATDS